MHNNYPVANRNTRTLVAGAIVGSILTSVTASAATQEKVSEPTVGQEAAAVALRYDCALTDIVNNGIADPNEHPTRNGVNRADLRVTVHLENTAQVEPILHKYQNDGTITWFPPNVGAYISTADGRELEVEADLMYLQPATSEPGRVGDINNVGLYPKTDYENGTTADVYVQQPVNYLEDGERIDMAGIIPCGTIVFNDGQWSMTEPSDRQPYIYEG